MAVMMFTYITQNLCSSFTSTKIFTGEKSDNVRSRKKGQNIQKGSVVGIGLISEVALN